MVVYGILFGGMHPWRVKGTILMQQSPVVLDNLVQWHSVPSWHTAADRKTSDRVYFWKKHTHT